MISQLSNFCIIFFSGPSNLDPEIFIFNVVESQSLKA